MAVARSLQAFGQVISSLASRNKQFDGNEQADIEIPYKESVRTELIHVVLGAVCMERSWPGKRDEFLSAFNYMRGFHETHYLLTLQPLK